MDELSLNDVEQLLLDNIVEYDGKDLMYVTEIGRNEGILFVRGHSYSENTVKTVEFRRSKFKAPPRIGYVNYEKGAIYVSRRPVRTWGLGINSNNTTLFLQGVKVLFSNQIVKTSELHKAYKNNYPPLSEIVSYRREYTIAFDKQFAIDAGNFVYYKGNLAGGLPANGKHSSQIQWDSGFDFCEILLENNYEKTVRTFKSKRS